MFFENFDDEERVHEEKETEKRNFEELCVGPLNCAVRSLCSARNGRLVESADRPVCSRQEPRHRCLWEGKNL